MNKYLVETNFKNFVVLSKNSNDAEKVVNNVFNKMYHLYCQAKKEKGIRKRREFKELLKNLNVVRVTEL